MKTILLPVDFSRYSANSLEFACAIAAKTGAKIILHHSFPSAANPFINTPPADYMQRYEEEQKEKIAERLDAFIREYEHYLCGCPLEYSIVKGTPVEAILENAKTLKADLIVMGTKGLDAVEEIFMGSVTAEVTEKAECPVMTIPRNAKFNGFRKVVYATDFDLDDVIILDFLQRLAGLFRSEIECLHVSTSEKETEEKKMQERFIFAPLDHIRLNIVKDKSFEKGIDQFIEKHETDLLVMLKQRRSFFERLFTQSKTKKMALHSTVPLLVLKA